MKRSPQYWLAKWRRRANRYLSMGLTTRGTPRKQAVIPRRQGGPSNPAQRKRWRERVRYRANHPNLLGKLRFAMSRIEHEMRAKLWGEEYLSTPNHGRWRLNHTINTGRIWP